MILEMGKSYINKFYDGDLQEATKNKDGFLWTDKRIKAAFNNGNGTAKDLKRYMQDNKHYCYFMEV